MKGRAITGHICSPADFLRCGNNVIILPANDFLRECDLKDLSSKYNNGKSGFMCCMQNLDDLIAEATTSPVRLPADAFSTPDHSLKS
jgi:hypothetical protein